MILKKEQNKKGTQFGYHNLLMIFSVVQGYKRQVEVCIKEEKNVYWRQENMIL